MGAMTSNAVIPTGRPFTVADLEAMPDDGNRYELIDGMLIVSPAPRWQHQLVLGELAFLLHGLCPRPLRLIIAPFDVQVDEVTSLEPDILVARFVDIAEKNLPAA